MMCYMHFGLNWYFSKFLAQIIFLWAGKTQLEKMGGRLWSKYMWEMGNARLNSVKQACLFQGFQVSLICWRVLQILRMRTRMHSIPQIVEL